MITHEDALRSANNLVDYCKERWKGRIGGCNKCQFQVEKNGRRSCYLTIFLGFGGEDLKKMADKDVTLRCKELMKDESR